MSKPIEPNNSIMVVTSFKCGKLLTFIGDSANKEAANTGKAEFFAPEAKISPLSSFLPVIRSLSIKKIIY